MIDRLAILADDLTGAADTGAAFAATGLRTVVLLSPDAPIPVDADVLVLSSESRALAAPQAVEATRRCAARIQTWRGGDAAVRVYKKVDSTLRGHPGVELAALMEALGEQSALVAPAFPAHGRTTVQGHQCIDGMRLERTVFGSEVRTSDLAAIFGAHSRASLVPLTRDDLAHGVAPVVARLSDGRDGAVWIADAADDADLAILAVAALASPLPVLCGSAGFARALAGPRRQGRGAEGSGAFEGRRPHDEGRQPVLVVAGSRHAATVAQVEALRRDGAVVVHPERALLEDGDASSAAVTATRVGEALSAGQVAVIATTAVPELRAEGRAVATRLASIVSRVVERAPVGGLVLTGGGTASAVCDALGARSLWLAGELEPGIALARLIGGRADTLAIVTKAGGFGDADALRRAVTFLAAVNA